MAVHADLDLRILQQVRKGRTRELASLIRVKDFRFGTLQRLFQRFRAEMGIYRIGDLPSQYVTAIPIQVLRSAPIGTPYRKVFGTSSLEWIEPRPPWVEMDNRGFQC